MSYWSKAAIDRDQIALIPTTWSDRIPEDHSVRLSGDLLSTYDWPTRCRREREFGRIGCELRGRGFLRY